MNRPILRSGVSLCPGFCVLVLLGPALLHGANPAITVLVSSETAPPGGYAQFKLTLSAPALVSTASVKMSFDPTIFGPAASIAAFSATGDQVGYANQLSQSVTASFSSSSASLGQLPDQPIFIVTVPVLSTAKIGATSSIVVDPTASPWKDQQQNVYTVTANPGTFTVGGSLSIQSVSPGGGLLPSGTLVTVAGTGFDATTTVTIDGVSLGPTQLKNAQEMDVPLSGATEMAGKHIHLSNAAGASVDYFASLPAGNLILPLLPSLPYTEISWSFPAGGALLTAYWCLQNSNAFPVTATYYGYMTGQPATIQTVTIPPYGLYIGPPGGLPLGTEFLLMTLSAPIRMTTFYDSFASAGPPAVQTLPVTPATGLGGLGIQIESSPASWNWELGTPAPAAQQATVLSPLPFTVSLAGSASAWLQVTPSSGAGGAELTLTPVVSNLSPGSYTGYVVITQQLPPGLAQFGPSTASLPVSITVSPQPTLLYGSGGIVFNAFPGGPAPPPMTIPISSNGTPAAFTVSTVGGSWLTVTPSSGTTPATLTLTANPGNLPAGNYGLDLFIKGPLNTQDIPVSLTLGSGTNPVQVSPAGIGINLTSGQGPSSPQTITVSSSSPVSLTITPLSGGNWLSATLVNANLIQVSATAVGLSPGTYQSTITVTSSTNGSTDVAVTLTVSPSGPSQFSISPSTLALSTAAGSSTTANINVTPVTGSPLFTAQVTGPIQIVGPPSQYIAPATIQFTTTATTPGTYPASIALSWTGGSATIPITITVTPSGAPIMSAIVSSASANPGSIAPGELISIFGAGLGAAPTDLQLNPSGTVATALNGTQVLINGVPVPLIYSSSNQVNAIVPYEVGSSPSATLQVVASGFPASEWTLPIASFAPALFTLSGAGVGQAAVINADGTVNSPSNPAARGSFIQIYATGYGQTTPSSSTGAVAQTATNLATPPNVSIGGTNAQVLYAGSATGEVNGVVQINAVVPPNIAPGAAIPLSVTTTGLASQLDATVAVQ